MSRSPPTSGLRIVARIESFSAQGIVFFGFGFVGHNDTTTHTSAKTYRKKISLLTASRKGLESNPGVIVYANNVPGTTGVIIILLTHKH